MDPHEILGCSGRIAPIRQHRSANSVRVHVWIEACREHFRQRGPQPGDDQFRWSTENDRSFSASETPARLAIARLVSWSTPSSWDDRCRGGDDLPLALRLFFGRHAWSPSRRDNR